ncbi:MAG: proprotein convertase P-domain-containing protein, partial [Acidobacteriota bacterium]|nr:proprotein convertase P-domain-containing protein [Acidobacteriota bacterium]
AVAVDVAGRTLVAYDSDWNASGNNPDGNIEVWITGGVFAPPQSSMFCNTPNLAIPDPNGAGVTDVISVATPGTLVDLNVSVIIEHTFVGDLRVDLRHVDTGTNARLIARPGRPPGAGCSGDDIDATLDDEATMAVENECVTPGPVAIAGTFSPNQALSRFDGEDLSGDWELRVSDVANGDAGTFVEWCLIPSTP